MARPTVLLLAVVVCLLGAHLPPAASRPALLKPEGSYTPEQREVIKVVDDLLNQLLRQLLQEYGEDTRPFSAEEESPYAGNSAEDQGRPQLPRPTRVPPAKPTRDPTVRPPGSADAGGTGSYGDSNTHPEVQPVNGGRIVFPSD